MDLLRQTFESFNPNQMTTQINVPHQTLSAFLEVCERMQITYYQIESRENDSRYEVITNRPADLYYLGLAKGLEVGHRIHTETLDQLQNGN